MDGWMVGLVGGWEAGRLGWREEKKIQGCVTSGEQAVGTVGGSLENGIIHVSLALSVYLPPSARRSAKRALKT